mmetsp:Transcript_7132/g.11410  ORF Transcript_7132/g.11410 Transcript_7132/m.11410 type:complete len:289 (+) Transcript_7132:124-990(+)
MGQSLKCCGPENINIKQSGLATDGNVYINECCSNAATSEFRSMPSALSPGDEVGGVVNLATIVQFHEPCCGPVRSVGPGGVIISPLAYGPTGQPFITCGLESGDPDRHCLKDKLLEFFESDHVWMVSHDDTWQKVLRDEPSCRDWALSSSSNPAADGSTSLKVAIVTPVNDSPNLPSSDFVLSWTNDDMELNLDFRCFEIRVRLVHASQRFREVLSIVTNLRLCYDLVSEDKPFHFALAGTIDPQYIVSELYLRVYWFHEFMWQSKELGFTSEPISAAKLSTAERFGL